MPQMLTVDPKDIPVPKLHGYILGSVAPRPIALASTIDAEGNPNLSPFSFFNAFSVNPPILIFSPARRAKDNTTKHTYENAKEVDEVVINVVNYALVEQASLSSSDFDKGVNEFEKAGLTPIDSVMVKPFRVKESPVQIECKVNKIIELGQDGGAGNLVICEIVLIHIDESILNESGAIDPNKIDLVSRMGGNWYSRASGDALFQINKPLGIAGIGIDGLPNDIRNSTVLSGSDLAKLGGVEKLPVQSADIQECESILLNEMADAKDSSQITEESVHLKAKDMLQNNTVEDSWAILLAYYNFKS